MEITIPLCAQCASFELSCWINEKQMKAESQSPCVELETLGCSEKSLISPTLARAIREELRYLSLAEGNCIVCNKDRISYGWMKRILKVMQKYQAPEEIRKEFISMFGFKEK